jgi:hypothetical protein
VEAREYIAFPGERFPRASRARALPQTTASTRSCKPRQELSAARGSHPQPLFAANHPHKRLKAQRQRTWRLERRPPRARTIRSTRCSTG